MWSSLSIFNVITVTFPTLTAFVRSISSVNETFLRQVTMLTAASVVETSPNNNPPQQYDHLKMARKRFRLQNSHIFALVTRSYANKWSGTSLKMDIETGESSDLGKRKKKKTLFKFPVKLRYFLYLPSHFNRILGISSRSLLYKFSQKLSIATN